MITLVSGRDFAISDTSGDMVRGRRRLSIDVRDGVATARAAGLDIVDVRTATHLGPV